VCGIFLPEGALQWETAEFQVNPGAPSLD
jgi:hypothetical protein